MEEIIESIINGQREQAIAQMQLAGLDLDQLMEELIAQGMINEVTRLYRVAVRIGYVVENNGKRA